MARTSTVVVSVILTVLLVLGLLALVYGPGLYREGKALVEPIVELSKAKDQLIALNSEMPFEPPDDGVVAEDRFQIFLDIRRELLPRYKAWQELEQRLDASGEEDWQTAKEVLAQVREIASAQRGALTGHGMSPDEFNWIEDRVYGVWAKGIVAAEGDQAVADALHDAAREDLATLDDVDRRYGPSRASHELRRRLETRLAATSADKAPSVEGISEDDARLFWAHREDINELDLERYSDLHDLLRESGNVEIKVGN
jgi:hypothetical protein